MAATDTRVGDLEEIRALTHRYGLALDTFDLDGIVEAFAADATFDCSAFGLEVYEGEESIRAFFAHNQQVMANQIHMYSNHIVEFDGPDEAHGTVYLEQDGYTHEGARIQCLGLNRDRYVRTDDGWRIAHRVITPLVPFHLEGYDER
jgi:ketosteroid isomerase-like protein